MHRSGLALLVLVAVSGCETMPEGAFNNIGKSVLGDVMDTAAADASSSLVRETAESMCSPDNTMCWNLTTQAVSGFTEGFMDQLTQSDVQKIDEARRISMETGQPRDWSNPETGASGTVTTAPAEPKPAQPTPVKVRKDRLQSLPMMDAVGEPYRVASSGSVNVRGGPGTSYEVVDRLAGGENITAIGRVREAEWFLVGRGSVGIGYVHGDLLEPYSPPADEPLDEALNEATGAEAAPDESDVSEVDVSMASECFTTTQTVTLASGETEEANITSCRTPDGWAQV